MKYCTKCLYPETKPDLWFDDNGVCSACLAFEARKNKDWGKLEETFHKIMGEHKNINSIYDCVIPVSGGKDSTYQIIKVKELGYRPLAVCARTDDLSSLGRKNLDNIGELGVDLIEVNTNRQIRKKLANYTLRTIGDISWAEHVSIFTIPFIIAEKFNIPIIIYGENPQNQYGGPEENQEDCYMSLDWLQEFGGLNGLRVKDIIDNKIATEEEMHLFKFPEVTHSKALFLGQFFEWDGKKNADMAKQNGFIRSIYSVEGNGSTYENLDNYQTGIHDYFKYLKFGFGRATDITCTNIRHEYISREDGKYFICTFDGSYPYTYLGKDLREVINYIGVTIEDFNSICVKFTNKELFTRNNYKKAPHLFLGVAPLFSEDLKNA